MKNDLKEKVIEILEKDFGWCDIVDDISLSKDLLNDTIKATEQALNMHVVS